MEFEKYLKTHSGRVFMNKRLLGNLEKMYTIKHGLARSSAKLGE